MLKSFIIFGALHVTFFVWYLGSLGVINEYPVTFIWMLGLFLAVGSGLIGVIKNKNRVTIEIEDLVFLCVILIISLIILRYRIEYGDGLDYNGTSSFDFNLNCVLYYIAFYFLGRYCLYSALRSRQLLVIGLFLLLGVVFLYTNYSEYKIRMDFIDVKKAGLYLVLSDIFAIASILAISSTNDAKLKIVMIFFSIVALFFLNSRASMYGYIFACAIYLFKNKNRFDRGYIILISVIVAVTISFSNSSIFVANERMAVALNGISDDGSFVDRLDQLSVGLGQIYSNPIFGDYGGTVRDFGFVGAYIHNIISYWQQFGVIVFGGVLYLVFIGFLSCANKIFIYAGEDFYAESLFFLGIFNITMILFARSYSWYFVWMYVGYSVSLKNKLFIKI